MQAASRQGLGRALGESRGGARTPESHGGHDKAQAAGTVEAADQLVASGTVEAAGQRVASESWGCSLGLGRQPMPSIFLKSTLSSCQPDTMLSATLA